MRDKKINTGRLLKRIEKYITYYNDHLIVDVELQKGVWAAIQQELIIDEIESNKTDEK